jgi:REP element-mobilizing transposase RayT
MRQIYFITSTVNHWIPLFHRADYAEIILEALSFRAEKGQIRINAYIIMPNHIHMMLTVNEGHTLTDFIRDFHKFTAKRIIETLEMENNRVLERFRVESRDRKIQVWRKTHSPKQITSWKFFLQKLEYIHNNPLNARWRLCERPEEYAYSSAGVYMAVSRGDKDRGQATTGKREGYEVAGKRVLPMEVITPRTPW